MVEELEKEYKFQETAYEIMQSLRERFGRPSDNYRKNMIQLISSYRLSDDSPVGPHIVKMLKYFDMVDSFGDDLSISTQMMCIMDSLPVKYLAYKVEFHRISHKYDLGALFLELQLFELLLDMDSTSVVGASKKRRSEGDLKS